MKAGLFDDDDGEPEQLIPTTLHISAESTLTPAVCVRSIFFYAPNTQTGRMHLTLHSRALR